MPRDTWLILKRELTLRLRNPLWIAIDVTHPLLYVFLFGPLMKKFVQHTPGFPAGSMWMIFTPAMMMQAAITTASFVGMSLLADYRAGVLERLRVSPIRPTSLLLGKVLAVALNVIALSGVILLATVGVFGLRPAALGVLISMLIVALFTITLASCSYAIALRLKHEQFVSALINAVMLPLLLLSGSLVPITTTLAPNWLYTLSRMNPASYIMDAGRASFRGDLHMATIGQGLAVLLIVTLLSLWWGARTLNRDLA